MNLNTFTDRIYTIPFEKKIQLNIAVKKQTTLLFMCGHKSFGDSLFYGYVLNNLLGDKESRENTRDTHTGLGRD